MRGRNRPRAVADAPGLTRRLGAVVYDALLLFSVLFGATALLLVFTGGEAIEPGNVLLTAYLGLVGFVYFAWCWTHGGQTLGMRAWRLRICTLEGKTPTWPQCGLRYLGAIVSWSCAGAGFLWVLLDKDRRAWHDRLSGTVLVRT